MASFNKVLLMGNLTRDPQLRYLPSQMAVCDFGLAINRRFKTAQGEDREEVVYIDCSAFGRQGEVINQYCQKGKAIFVEGRLKLDQWEDKQGGGKRSKLSVVVDTFQFVGGRDGGGGGGGRGEGGAGGYDDAQPDPGGPPARGMGGMGGGGGGAMGGGRGGARPGQGQQPPAQPYSDEPQFKDDDIPF